MNDRTSITFFLKKLIATRSAIVMPTECVCACKLRLQPVLTHRFPSRSRPTDSHRIRLARTAGCSTSPHAREPSSRYCIRGAASACRLVGWGRRRRGAKRVRRDKMPAGPHERERCARGEPALGTPALSRVLAGSSRRWKGSERARARQE
jgi:hypothetical protein